MFSPIETIRDTPQWPKQEIRFSPVECPKPKSRRSLQPPNVDVSQSISTGNCTDTGSLTTATLQGVVAVRCELYQITLYPVIFTCWHKSAAHSFVRPWVTRSCLFNCGQSTEKWSVCGPRTPETVRSPRLHASRPRRVGRSDCSN